MQNTGSVESFMQLDIRLQVFVLLILAFIGVISAVSAVSFIRNFMKEAENVPGKKDIFTRIYFLLGVVNGSYDYSCSRPL